MADTGGHDHIATVTTGYPGLATLRRSEDCGGCEGHGTGSDVQWGCLVVSWAGTRVKSGAGLVSVDQGGGGGGLERSGGDHGVTLAHCQPVHLKVQTPVTG